MGSKRGNGQRIRRAQMRRRKVSALQRLEERWETADPEEAELIAEEADALAYTIPTYPNLPKGKWLVRHG